MKINFKKYPNVAHILAKGVESQDFTKFEATDADAANQGSYQAYLEKLEKLLLDESISWDDKVVGIRTALSYNNSPKWQSLIKQLFNDVLFNNKSMTWADKKYKSIPTDRNESVMGMNDRDEFNFKVKGDDDLSYEEKDDLYWSDSTINNDD